MMLLLAALSLVVAWPCQASAGDDDRPSLLMVVFDTTRADAVSAYGFVSGTTPTFDGLAREGILYSHAYATAPWTSPSHATLFSGLAPGVHGVGVRRFRAADSLVTLAEHLREAGYATAAFSENPMLGMSNLLQGFDHFTEEDRFDSKVVESVQQWMTSRSCGVST